MAVVVVESPAKAKTINSYLGSGYTVLASYGHVRDLPSKDGSVDPDAGFEMKWEIDAKSQKHVRAIAEALAEDDRLILATDPDREGEAISWHLLEALRKRRAVKKDTDVKRVVFNAITKAAVSKAMETPRDIDAALVEAYLARRALDYLVGFTLSPVLWRKLPGARSAGRVQSVALRLIVEREMEIEAFRPREYWTVKAVLTTPAGAEFEARLVTLDGAKLDRFDLADEAAAQAAVAAVRAAALQVVSVEAKPQTRNPAPPFMTSTLQQEASRKLGFGAQQTMRAAQRLYEAGHITYMRTDGIDMAPEAVTAARDAIGARYGRDYLPEKPRYYKNKAKNAQEAHECIRPTQMNVAPGELRGPERDEARLYELIWKRAIASQMEAARFRRTTVEIADESGRTGLRATGQVVTFDGFLRVYEEGRDDVESDDDRRLPEIPEGAALAQRGVTPEQHFTQPPPRYTEATLVKRMEELGIGRPSTYASIITTIQDREYVRKDKNRLIPEDKGRLVTAFLENYFRKYVAYDFTAELEEELDEVSAGKIDWKKVLDDFWKDFRAAVDQTQDLRISEVLETINEVLAPHLFPDKGDGSDPRACPNCQGGRLAMKTARSGGAFIGCSNYPACRYTRPLAGEQSGDDGVPPEGKLLGHDENGVPVSLRTGRFGPYVQLGEEDTASGAKPKRSSLLPELPAEDVTLEIALALLALPREVGQHPEDGQPVEAGIGRYGPYVRHGRTYASLEKGDDVLKVGMNRAMELIARKATRGGRGAGQEPLRDLGEHPDGGPVTVMKGRYGPYVKWGKVNATLPKDRDPQAIGLDEALALVEAKAGAKKSRKKPAAKSATTAAQKKPAKKTTKTSKAKTAGQKVRAGRDATGPARNQGFAHRGLAGSCRGVGVACRRKRPADETARPRGDAAARAGPRSWLRGRGPDASRQRSGPALRRRVPRRIGAAAGDHRPAWHGRHGRAPAPLDGLRPRQAWMGRGLPGRDRQDVEPGALAAFGRRRGDRQRSRFHPRAGRRAGGRGQGRSRPRLLRGPLQRGRDDAPADLRGARAGGRGRRPYHDAAGRARLPGDRAPRADDVCLGDARPADPLWRRKDTVGRAGPHRCPLCRRDAGLLRPAQPLRWQVRAPAGRPGSPRRYPRLAGRLPGLHRAAPVLHRQGRRAQLGGRDSVAAARSTVRQHQPGHLGHRGDRRFLPPARRRKVNDRRTAAC